MGGLNQIQVCRDEGIAFYLAIFFTNKAREQCAYGLYKSQTNYVRNRTSFEKPCPVLPFPELNSRGTFITAGHRCTCSRHQAS